MIKGISGNQKTGEGFFSNFEKTSINWRVSPFEKTKGIVMVDLVDQPSGNGATAAAAQWWSAEQCPDDAQGQGGPTDRPDLHQTIPNPRSIYAKADPLTEQTDTKPNPRPISHLSRCASVWFERWPPEKVPRWRKNTFGWRPKLKAFPLYVWKWGKILRTTWFVL